jgi:hypothetical protein
VQEHDARIAEAERPAGVDAVIAMARIRLNRFAPSTATSIRPMISCGKLSRTSVAAMIRRSTTPPR